MLWLSALRIVGNQRLRRGYIFSGKLHCGELGASGISIGRRFCGANELFQQLRAGGEVAAKSVEICQCHLQREYFAASFDAGIELLSGGSGALRCEEKANDLEFGGRISRIGGRNRTHQFLGVIQSLMRNVELHKLRFESEVVWAKFDKLSQLRFELLQISHFLEYFDLEQNNSRIVLFCRWHAVKDLQRAFWVIAQIFFAGQDDNRLEVTRLDFKCFVRFLNGAFVIVELEQYARFECKSSGVFRIYLARLC